MTATWRRLDRDARRTVAVAASWLLATFGLSAAWAATGGSWVPAGFSALAFATFLESVRLYADDKLDAATMFAFFALGADLGGIAAMLPALPL